MGGLNEGTSPIKIYSELSAIWQQICEHAAQGCADAEKLESAYTLQERERGGGEKRRE